MNKCKCEKCGYEWYSRVEEPKACPNCTSRLWNKEAKKKVTPEPPKTFFDVVVEELNG